MIGRTEWNRWFRLVKVVAIMESFLVEDYGLGLDREAWLYIRKKEEMGICLK